MRIVQRGFSDWPLTNLSLLCIQELLLRSCRRPIKRRSAPPEGGTPNAETNFVFTRAISCTNTSGAKSMSLSAVRRRADRQGLSGPRSIPWGACFSFRKVRFLTTEDTEESEELRELDPFENGFN